MLYCRDFSNVADSADEPLVIHGHGDRPGSALLVLIHGLGGDRYLTWTPRRSSPTRISLPKFLHEDIESLDIGLYAYTSLWARLKFWKATKFESEVKVLADRLRERAAVYDSIVIAGHSLGGILAGAALCDLIQRNERSILSKIRGLFLFATPQAGSLWSQPPLAWFSEEGRILRAFSPNLQRMQETFTDRLVPDFAQANENKFAIPVFGIIPSNDRWVDMFSSSLGIARSRTNVIRGSHTSAVKPQTKQDDAYVWFRDNLKHLVDPALDPTSASVPNDKRRNLPLITSNLPRIQPFYGRAHELNFVRRALESSSWGVLIEGSGGMGKTSLAIEAANNCTPGMFRRLIFLSAKDREMNDDGEYSRNDLLLNGAVEIINELARQLDRSDIAKSPEPQKLRLLVEALRGTQTLAILDNIESLSKADQQQLLTLVRNIPQGCKAIMTCRPPRVGSSSEVLPLGKLDPESSLRIIDELAERNALLARSTALERDELCIKTGGNPLLLRWIAGQLGYGSCRTIKEAIQFLSTCPSANDPLEFIFGDIANGLSSSETTILCALTHFNLPARIDHLAKLTDGGASQIQSELQTLANKPLVEPDQTDSTYVLIPMVSVFLGRKWSAAVARSGDRILDLAFAEITQNGARNHKRFTSLENDWPIIAAALPLYLNRSDARLQSVCADLYCFLNFTGRWDELRSLNEQAEEKAVATGDKYNGCWRSYQTGLVYHRLGQPERVLECSNRVSSYALSGQPVLDAPSLAAHLVGLANRLQGNHQAAAESFRRALEYAQPLPRSRNLPIFLADLAEDELNLGNAVQAEAHLQEALDMVTDDDEVLFGCKIRLARVLLNQNRFLEAETLARESLSNDFPRLEFRADNLVILAQSLLEQGKRLEALPFAQSAVEIYGNLHSPKIQKVKAILGECQSKS